MDRTFRCAEGIILDVALTTGVSIDLIRSPLRTRTIVGARREVCRRLLAETDLSWREIGMVVGKRGRYDPRYR